MCIPLDRLEESPVSTNMLSSPMRPEWREDSEIMENSAHNQFPYASFLAVEVSAIKRQAQEPDIFLAPVKTYFMELNYLGW